MKAYQSRSVLKGNCMLNLGGRVKHQETGNIGIVVGLEQQIFDNKCLPIAKVKIISPESCKKTTVKDLNSKWIPCQEDFRVIYPNPMDKHRIYNLLSKFGIEA